MTFIRVLALATIMAAGTWFAGWYAVPVIAAIYALLVRRSYAPDEAALAALFAWGALLARAAAAPAFGTLLGRLGGIFPIPGSAVAVVTVAIAVLLAWSAARIVSALVVREPNRV